jgi:hypothetical protein
MSQYDNDLGDYLQLFSPEKPPGDGLFNEGFLTDFLDNDDYRWDKFEIRVKENNFDDERFTKPNQNILEKGGIHDNNAFEDDDQPCLSYDEDMIDDPPTKTGVPVGGDIHLDKSKGVVETSETLSTIVNNINGLSLATLDKPKRKYNSTRVRKARIANKDHLYKRILTGFNKFLFETHRIKLPPRFKEIISDMTLWLILTLDSYEAFAYIRNLMVERGKVKLDDDKDEGLNEILTYCNKHLKGVTIKELYERFRNNSPAFMQFKWKWKSTSYYDDLIELSKYDNLRDSCEKLMKKPRK